LRLDWNIKGLTGTPVTLFATERFNEYMTRHSETILDLDWSSTPDMQSILAVGYAHRVDILCQQRMTYFDEGPGWALCRTIDISGFVLRVVFGILTLILSKLDAISHQRFYLVDPWFILDRRWPTNVLLQRTAGILWRKNFRKPDGVCCPPEWPTRRLPSPNAAPVFDLEFVLYSISFAFRFLIHRYR